MVKTASIHVYPLFQAKGYGVQATYRGKAIATATNADKREAMRIVETVCENAGFTHAKIAEESAWQKVTRYKIKLDGTK